LLSLEPATTQKEDDLTPYDEAILNELYNLYCAFAEIKGPAQTWDEVNALHDELCALDGGNLLPGITDKEAERLSPAGRLCALILPRTELMSREFYQAWFVKGHRDEKRCRRPKSAEASEKS
jgi:hypothetical protein